MLTVVVTVSSALPYGGQAPSAPLQEHMWLFDNWLGLEGRPSPEDEEAWAKFVEENPPPTACCLYFIEISGSGFPRLVYIGSTFRQWAHKRLVAHHVNAGLVKLLQASPGSHHVAIRYSDIEQFDYGPLRLFPEDQPEKSITLPPDLEPLWTLPDDEQESIIRDTEAALIFKLKPALNKRNKSSYRGQPIRVILWDAPWVSSGKFSFILNLGE